MGPKIKTLHWFILYIWTSISLYAPIELMRVIFKYNWNDGNFFRAEFGFVGFSALVQVGVVFWACVNWLENLWGSKKK